MIEISQVLQNSNKQVNQIDISINTSENYWIIPLNPMPDTTKAISGVRIGLTWSTYKTIDGKLPGGQPTKFGCGAVVYPCPTNYSESITYADIKQAGGFNQAEVSPASPGYLELMGENPPPFDTYAIFSSENMYSKIIKNRCVAVRGGADKPGISAVIKSATFHYTYTDAIPYPTNMSPSAGVIDEKSDNIFRWEIGADGVIGSTLTQQNAKFEWKLKGETDEKIRFEETGSNQYYRLPANTLEDGDIILWRVTVTSNMGIKGEPSAWIELGTHETEPPKCRTLSPNGIYVDGKSDITFRWEHISPIGSKPTGYDIQVKKENQWATVKTEMKTDKTMCRIPGTEFKAGTNYWRARTYNSDEVVGYWSDATAFCVVAKPEPPSIFPIVQGKPRPLIRWTSVGQTGYQVQVLRNGVVVYDSDMTAGTDTSHQISEYLDDGTYLFRVRIQNMFNKLSEWGEYNHTISTKKPEKPTFIAVSVPDVGVRINLTYQLKDGETAKVKRDGKMIADIKNEFWDYSALGEVTYSIIVIDRNDCFNESEKQTLSYYIKNVQLSLASDLKQTVHLKLHTEPNAPIRETYGSIGYTESIFAGRDLPCIDFSEHSSERVTLNFACKTPAEFEKLKSMCKLRQPFLYRDHMGEQFYCIIPEFTDTKLKVYTTFQLTLIKIDYRGDAR